MTITSSPSSQEAAGAAGGVLGLSAPPAATLMMSALVTDKGWQLKFALPLEASRLALQDGEGR